MNLLLRLTRSLYSRLTVKSISCGAVSGVQNVC